MQYRPEIDGLRALAVVAVIVNHFSKDLLPSGYLGVDIFFVISGYVITASLYERSARGLGTLLVDFYARRVKRLLPALVLFVLGTSVLISLVNPSPSISLKTGLGALFGLANLYLVRQATDYFGDSAQLNAFTHTWSLGVEEQFYLFFPFIVWMTAFRRHEGGRRWPFYTLLGLLSAASLAAFVHFNQSIPEQVYYMMPTRFWQLGAGSFAFWLVDREGAQPRARPWAAALVLAATLGCLAAPAAFNTWTTIAATALAVLLVWLTRAGTLPYAVFTTRSFVFVGLISYSLYLWHWTVLAVSRWSVGIHWWTVPVQVALMLLLAVLSYRYVEKPLRTATWSSRKWVNIAIGFGGAGLAAVLLLVMIRPPMDGRLYMGQRPPLQAFGVDSLDHVYELDGSRWEARRCVLFDNGDAGKSITPEGCTLGDFAQADRRVLVVGNSQVAAFTHAFDQMVRQDRVAVTLVSSWGASPVPEIANHTPWAGSNEHFWARVVPSLIARLQAGDWVVMGSELAMLGAPRPTLGHKQLLAQYRQGLERLSDELGQRGIRLAVIHSLPYLREANCDPAAAMDQWFSPMGGPCKYISREATLQRRAPLDDVLRDLAAQGRVTVIDLFDLFCPDSTCDYRGRGGIYMYRDVWAHPSIEAARLSAPVIREALLEPGAAASAGVPASAPPSPR